MPRYIDADKHLQKLGERRDTAIIWELNCNDEATKDIAREAILIFNECILELINAPTADVRENVRGEWIKLDEEPVYIIECSECGDKLLNMIGQPLPKFCSNCGADMRGESHE